MALVYHQGEPPKMCERDDCSVANGWTSIRFAEEQRYDKTGKPLPCGPSFKATDRDCKTCGARWTVKHMDSDDVEPPTIEVTRQPRTQAEPA